MFCIPLERMWQFSKEESIDVVKSHIADDLRVDAECITLFQNNGTNELHGPTLTEEARVCVRVVTCDHHDPISR